ncbi:type II secretion system GspH family protein [Patescibacteria group bacterium]|nr:type II secretion system GspH family protein [Patescibacteria group bacterium]
MIKRLNTARGFTLIELLVVISIIAILIAFGTARYITAEKGARDTARKSDLNQYRIALENYASAYNSLYPGGILGDIDSLCGKVVTGGTFASVYLSGGCLNDPRAGIGLQEDYNYRSDPTGSVYVLVADLEKSTDFFVVCSNGRSGVVASKPSGTTCPAF